MGGVESRKDRTDRFKKRVRRRNKIEKVLLEQLKDEYNNPQNQELIKDYLFMWDTVEELPPNE